MRADAGSYVLVARLSPMETAMNENSGHQPTRKDKPDPRPSNGNATIADQNCSGADSTAKSGKPPVDPQPPAMMRFKECAQDGNVCVKTIVRWVDAGFLTEWRPHPKSRTRRIQRAVWEAFKKRNR